MADSPRLTELEQLQQRQEAILAGMQTQALYPEPTQPSVGDFERDARVPGVGDFSQATSNEYEYKDPTAPGAAPGRQAGPMAQELRGIPGVVKPGPDGLDRVDTDRLSLTNASQTGENVREIDNLRKRLDALHGATSMDKKADDVLAVAGGRR
jgi:hypothetical protein